LSRSDSNAFGQIHTRINRYDLILSISDDIRYIIKEIVAKGGDAMSTVISWDAELLQLSVVISDPGAPAQTRHSDTIYCPREPSGGGVITILAALQTVDETMGPTKLWPGTHGKQFHDLPTVAKSFLLDEMKPKVMVATQGDCVMYNSLVFHCGGENTSSRRRSLLSVTFGRSRLNKGTTDSLRAEYAGRFKLSDFR
jgi:ectoine hydroxylase-related dioxygenase (phytanoyl-CoA dioxygenase family)